jgi:hypothetical protein
METNVLKEIKEIRNLLSQLIGTSDLPSNQRFSKEALDKAAEQFTKLSIQRGEWIPDGDIGKIIKKAPYYSGKFIIEHFGFTNYFMRGRVRFFNRKDLIALNNELKERNINLSRYMELINDQENFKKKLESSDGLKVKKKGKRFHIPNDLRDIETSPPPAPSKDLVEKNLEELKEEFKTYKMSEYIDVYNDSHAMMKFEYYFDKYLDANMKKRCKKWCDNFNYANNALERINSIAE